MWLKYKNGATTTERQFAGLTIFQRGERDSDKSRTLRRIDVDFLLSRRRVYLVTIGADELYVDAARNFVRAWLLGGMLWFSTSTSGTPPSDATDPYDPADGDYVRVTIDGGVDPLEFLESIPNLATITLTVTEKFPRSSNY